MGRERCNARGTGPGYADIQALISEELTKHCSKARPSKQAHREWSSTLTDLTSAIQKARREWSKSGEDRWCQIYKALRNDLKKEIWKGSRRKWREFVHTASEDTK